MFITNESELEEATHRACQAIFTKFPGNWQDQQLVELVKAALSSQILPAEPDPVRSWTFGEARTRHNQLIHFGATKSDLALVKAAVERLVEIDLPEATEYVGHGSYSAYSRYKLEQLKYAGGGGYIEVLHIADAPDGRCRDVVYLYSIYGDCWFWEFPNRTLAVAAWNRCWGLGGRIVKAMGQQRGLIRAVFCDTLQPWFYAVGNQIICGDLVFPAYTQDHPYFVPGQYYLVDSKDEPGEQEVKRCIGSRIEYVRYSRDYINHGYVFWDDGTISYFDEQRLRLYPPPVAGTEDIGYTLGEFRRLCAQDVNTAIDVLNELRARTRTVQFKAHDPG